MPCTGGLVEMQYTPLTVGPTSYFALLQVVEDDVPFPAEGACTAELQDLLRKCLCKDPQRRPSAEALIRHPWLQQVSPAVANCSACLDPGLPALPCTARLCVEACLLGSKPLQRAAIWAVRACLANA